MQRATVGLEKVTTAFSVANPLDHIQKFHLNGTFYELNQLLRHRDLIQRQITVLDIGANVGNHSLFYAHHTDATRIYPIEANPEAIAILSASVELNAKAKAKIDLRHLGVAVGSKPGRVSIVSSQPNNLGGTAFSAAESTGEIDCVRLDDLAFEGRIGFIKLDVERTELDVLAGAEKIIARSRPVLAIEVVQANEEAFWKWLESHRYKVVGAFFDYINVKNYLCIPAF